MPSRVDDTRQNMTPRAFEVYPIPDMADQKSMELPIRGMDCAECAAHVRAAISSVDGVTDADVLLGAEKAIVRFTVDELDLDRIHESVRRAGYEVATGEGGDAAQTADGGSLARGRKLTRQVLTLFALAFSAVLFVVVVGEGLGLFDELVERVPWYVALAAVLAGGYPIFRNVVTAGLRGRIIAHTLMTFGAVAAMVAGEWVTAAIVVFFMRLGDFAERFTAEKARGSIRGLEAMAPEEARVERDGREETLSLDAVNPGDVVVVRPGERIPVDGEVISGSATIDQSAITGEPMPVDVEEGSRVFAATIPTLGSLRIRAEQIGSESTFGRVIRMVEDAEANRGEVQRVADKFSGYYLPVVAGIAALTFVLSGDVLSTVAVLVVACSCSFALATPIAILASIGAAARQGLLVKGGKYLELLDRASVLLVDKTGTLTLGRPRVALVVPAGETAGVGQTPAASESAQADLLRTCAAAEWYSEHPIARGIMDAAVERGLEPTRPEAFEALPGVGVRGTVAGRRVEVRKIEGDAAEPSSVAELRAQGATIIAVYRDETLMGHLALQDTPREDVPAALRSARELGMERVELLTGDGEASAMRLAGELGIAYRAELLPEHKTRIVQEYQAAGRTVVMVGDGVNDAPALAQADVGVAMGAAGSDVAVEAAHVALLRDDWSLVPELLRVAKRSLRVIRGNIGFTAVYNLAGLSLAAFGILPPVFAAAAQSLPDLGILANSSRLLRRR